MKITMTIRPIADNEISFYDACLAASKRLQEIAQHALDAGDMDQAVGNHPVTDDVNGPEYAELIGSIKVTS